MLTTVSLLLFEMACYLGIYNKIQASKARERLLHVRKQPKKLPVDSKLKRMSGHLSTSERFASRNVVRMIRTVVNTQAFEHAMDGLINPRSEWHKIKIKLPKARYVL